MKISNYQRWLVEIASAIEHDKTVLVPRITEERAKEIINDLFQKGCLAQCSEQFLYETIETEFDSDGNLTLYDLPKRSAGFLFSKWTVQ